MHFPRKSGFYILPIYSYHHHHQEHHSKKRTFRILKITSFFFLSFFGNIIHRKVGQLNKTTCLLLTFLWRKHKKKEQKFLKWQYSIQVNIYVLSPESSQYSPVWWLCVSLRFVRFLRINPSALHRN